MALARVGERAGYSRGIVTHHFGVETGVADALARATQSAFVSGFTGTAPDWSDCLTLVHGYVGALGDLDPMNRAFLLLWTEALPDAELSDILRSATTPAPLLSHDGDEPLAASLSVPELPVPRYPR